MTRQMAIPFRIGPDGAVASVTDPVKSLSQRVRAMVATLPTQRVMRASFGVPTVDVMFDWDPLAGQTQLEQMVSEAVSVWEPSARILSVQPVLSDDGAQILGVNVDISAGDPVGAAGSTQYAVRISGNGEIRRMG
ncbi:GPW/gp25 family protein [Streptomyces sp. NPDC088252]|uniref:GPW/gp25 family protein n=1 Tax=Streptomyces sp. NPDC088252 TaxID=3365845 RepID=UPI00380DDC01